MQTTILLKTPMAINSIYQSASVIEFQKCYDSTTKTLVRIDVEPYAPRIVCATDDTEYTAVTIDKNGTVYAATTTGKRVALTKHPTPRPRAPRSRRWVRCGLVPTIASTQSIKQKSISYTRRLYSPPV